MTVATNITRVVAITPGESLKDQIEKFGVVGQGCCVIEKDDSGYHMRDALDWKGAHRHDLPLDTTQERLEAHWNGFVDNVLMARKTHSDRGHGCD